MEKKSNTIFTEDSLKFVLLIFSFMLFFISIVYENESIEKEIRNKEILLENKRHEYITTKTHLMSFTRYSKIKEIVEPLGFRESLKQPIIIEIPDEQVD
ncbi:MAG: hypothetical protein CMP58_02325 [Flavobacteriales bacterium]|nr:hypothetical protein [Flavobacteriales bacterium]